MIFWIVGGVVAIILIWAIVTSNSFKRANVKIDEAESGIDVALTKRFDVLTKMRDAVKGYSAHEKSTFAETISIRKGMSMGERNEAHKQMNEMQASINALAEAYPELRASENFMALQHSITDVEEHLQAARRLYNGNVSTYNQSIIVFPKSIIAGMMKMVKREFFEAEAAKRLDVKMDF